MLLPRTCNDSPEYWTIEQKNSTIAIEFHDSSHTAGIEMAVERTKFEKAKGPLNKNFARLEGEFGSVERGVSSEKQGSGRKFPVTYELEYDPKTEHLAGTRNGAPVRFIRADFQPVDLSRCQPVP